MANVTDSVFRKLFAKYGKPDVIWTEFVSADGLISPGRKALLKDLVFDKKTERPIVAQLFTGHPEAMKKASALAAKLGFDGIDINMGCPDRAVEKQGGGAAHIRDPKTALQVLQAARDGVKSALLRSDKQSFEGQVKKDIPISIKTRIGYNKVDMGWIRTLLEQNLPVLTVHLRTRKEMSLVPAHWELMPEIVALRNEISPDTLIIGNGDVKDVEDGMNKITASGCDGVMIGRGIFGTPWLFENIHDKNGPKNAVPRTPEERLKILVEHSKAFEKTFKGIKSFAIMRKHFKAYVNGWPGAAELRAELMLAETAKDVAKIVKKWVAANK